MTTENYVLSIVNKYKRQNPSLEVQIFIESILKPLIRRWAGSNLAGEIEYSGSTAKGTATTFGSDVDLFIPLNNSVGYTLETYYNGLFNVLVNYNPKKQNVSIRIRYSNYDIDIVPGRLIDGYRNYFNLYKNKTGTWILTNIYDNIKLIKESGRINEIIAIKIWRDRHGLDISSTLLELIVIRALKYQTTYDISSNVSKVLNYIKEEILSLKIEDPSNSNNILTDDLTLSSRFSIYKQAEKSSKAAYWSEVLW